MTVRIVYRQRVPQQRGLGDIGIAVYRRVLVAIADARGKGGEAPESFELEPDTWKALMAELDSDWPMGLLEPGDKFGPMLGGVVVVAADPPIPHVAFVPETPAPEPTGPPDFGPLGQP